MERLGAGSHGATHGFNPAAAWLTERGRRMLAATQALAAQLKARGASLVILFGSLARGANAIGPLSDVDLVVVMPGVEGERMHRRLQAWPEVAAFPYPLDLFIDTPDEWKRAIQTAFIAAEVVNKGVVRVG